MYFAYDCVDDVHGAVVSGAYDGGEVYVAIDVDVAANFDQREQHASVARLR